MSTDTICDSSEYSASRAMLKLELEGKGCNDAFEPQLSLVRNVRCYAAQTLQCAEEVESHDTLHLRHVVFRKVC